MNKLIALISLFFTAGIAFVFWYLHALGPVQTGDETRMSVKIEQGLSVEHIAQTLVERNAIRSVRAFKIYVKLNDAGSSLQAGSFILQSSFSTAEVVEVLTTGKSEEMIITIPEGFTIKDIDALLAEKDLITEGEFVECAQSCDFSEHDFLPDSSAWVERAGQVEGYLYPDTYFVIAANFSVEGFANRLLSTFQRKVVEGLYEKQGSARSLADIMAMASLVEEETRRDDERATVSGILWKRYDANLGLGVDATLRYILGKPTDAITVADLNTNNPYNTRKFRGLPPGPIANPGYQSILAAMHPKQSEYLYYLHGNDGTIHYAITNEQHNINRYQFLK